MTWLRYPDPERHDRFQSDVASHVRDCQNFRNFLATLANPKEKPMTLFYDEAVEAQNQREIDTENAPKVVALERLALSNAIELPRRRESWVARDLRWVYEAAQRVFGVGA